MIIMPVKLQVLMDRLKVVSAETYYHSIHVKNIAAKMLKKMNSDGITNYSHEKMCAICKGALLHDIGKLYIKNVVLTKPDALSAEERKYIQLHPRLSFNAVKNELNETEYNIVKNICLYHHERIDGNGYAGKTKLPIYVQVISVCDVFDALHSNRIYRDSVPYNKTLEIIESGGCGYFDKTIIEYLKAVTAEDEE